MNDTVKAVSHTLGQALANPQAWNTIVISLILVGVLYAFVQQSMRQSAAIEQHLKGIREIQQQDTAQTEKFYNAYIEAKRAQTQAIQDVLTELRRK